MTPSPVPKTGDVVLMWRGAITASRYPVPAEEQNNPERWTEAAVIEGPRFLPRRGELPSLYLGPVDGGTGFSPLWVPPAGWKVKT